MVPGFPEYEVSARLRVRKTMTGHEIAKTGMRVRLVKDGVTYSLYVRDLWDWANNPEAHDLNKAFGSTAAAEPVWHAVPLFEKYQVSERMEVRNTRTGKLLKPTGRLFAFLLDRRIYYVSGEDALGMARDPEHPKLAELRETLGLLAEPVAATEPGLEAPGPDVQEETPDFIEEMKHDPGSDGPGLVDELAMREAPVERDPLRAFLRRQAKSSTGCPWRDGKIETHSEWDWAGILPT